MNSNFTNYAEFIIGINKEKCDKVWIKSTFNLLSDFFTLSLIKKNRIAYLTNNE